MRYIPEQRFAHVWWPLIAMVPISAALAYAGASWLVKPLSPGQEVAQIALGVVLIIAAIYFLTIILRDMLTVIGEDGVSRRTPLGARFYPWPELRRIDSRGYLGRLVFANGAISINLLLYKDSAKVASFIRSKMPAQAHINFIGTRPAPPTDSYDVLGNLRSVTLPDGTLIEYAIDASNRRIGRKVNGTLSVGWIYSAGQRIIAETDGMGAITKRFIYGSRDNVPDYVVWQGSAYRIVTDHLGSSSVCDRGCRRCARTGSYL